MTNLAACLLEPPMHSDDPIRWECNDEGRYGLSLALFYIYGLEFKSSYPKHHALDDKVYGEVCLYANLTG